MAKICRCGNWGRERFRFLRKSSRDTKVKIPTYEAISGAPGSHSAIENVPSGTCEEIGFETKPAARNGTDAQSSAILSSAFISVLTTAALLLA
jgi:hypothetical protein